LNLGIVGLVLALSSPDYFNPPTKELKTLNLLFQLNNGYFPVAKLPPHRLIRQELDNSLRYCQNEDICVLLRNIDATKPEKL
jgi:hypothetical protein